MVNRRVSWSLWTLCIALLFLTLYKTPFQTSDTIWSAYFGHWMIVHRHVPMHDHWTWTAFGHPWVAQEWGFDVVLSWVSKAFLFRGVVLLMTLVSTATWILLALLLQARGQAYPKAVTAAMAVLSLPWDQIRAETWSYLFVVCTLWLLHLAKRYRWQATLSLLLLDVVWVNVHGSFVLGIALVLGAGMVAYLPSFHLHWLEHEQDHAWGKQALWTGVGMTALTGLNPRGYALWKFVVWLSFGAHIGRYILEWQPPVATELYTAGLLIAGLGWTIWRLTVKAPMSLWDTLLLLVALVLFAKAVRFGSYVCLLLPLWGTPLASLRAPRKALRWPAGAALGCALGLAGLSLFEVLPIRGTLTDHAVPKLEPKVVSVVERIHREHPHWRLWNGYDLGGTLETVGIPVSIDGRTGLYLSDGMMRTYMQTTLAGPSAMHVLRSERIRYAALARTAPLATLLDHSRHWQATYHGRYYDVFVRRMES